MSPSSPDAWKMEGLLNTKTAWPEVPVRERVRLTSGTVFSSMPLMNWMEAALQTTAERRTGATERTAGCARKAAARAGRTPRN